MTTHTAAELPNFNPDELPNKAPSASKSAPRSERLFIEVTGYETPADNFHYAVGHRVGGAEDEIIKVRLTTVAERMIDRPKSDAAQVTAQYSTGENIRETISVKEKAGIKFISFDDSRLISDSGGVKEYRAHWPKTMSVDPSAEVIEGMAHIKLRDAYKLNGKDIPAQANVEILKSSTVATQDNTMATLLDALSIVDDNGRAQSPLLIMRITLNGNPVAEPRMYPSSVKASVFDQSLGGMKDEWRKVSAEQTVKNLLDAVPGRSAYENAQLDSIRAVVAGVLGIDEPKFNSPKEDQRNLRNLYFGAKSGGIGVELISAERIEFGSDSRKTYMSEKTRPHLAVYNIPDKTEEGSKKTYPGFTETVIAVLRHEDGQPFAVFATPQEMYAKPKTLSELTVPERQEPENNQSPSHSL